MIELLPENFSRAAPLLADLGRALLARAVLEGCNPGWVFVDDPARPASAWIGLPCGYLFALGRSPQPAQYPALAALIRRELVGRSRAAGNYGFLLRCGAAGWAELLPELLPGRTPLRIFRRSFRLDAGRFAAVAQSLGPLPPGLELERIQAGTLERFPELREELLVNWRGVEDFLRDGLGVAITRGAELAAWCLSPFACSAGFELSVFTAPDFRRQGLARRAAAAFLGLCLPLAKTPNWECFWDNLPSTNLALSLGYVFEEDAPVYYWEESPSGLG